MRPVEKVTCLVTRRNGSQEELVVFDHPLAGVQLPAGTSLSGEDVVQAALREGWEETGIPRLSPTQFVGVLQTRSPAALRHRTCGPECRSVSD